MLDEDLTLNESLLFATYASLYRENSQAEEEIGMMRFRLRVRVTRKADPAQLLTLFQTWGFWGKTPLAIHRNSVAMEMLFLEHPAIANRINRMYPLRPMRRR